MKIYKDWDRKDATSAKTRNYAQRKGVAVHHTVTECAGETVAAEAAHMRMLQQLAFSRGFSDISYNHILFPKSGRIWKGRGFGVVGAHDDDSNTDFLGLAVVGNFEVSKASKFVATRIVDYIRFAEDAEHLPEHPVVYGHRDHDATACPGKHLYAHIPEIRRQVGGRKP